MQFSPMSWGGILVAWLAINAWTMHSFYDDKMRAIEGRRRIPEGSLLRLALVGGSIGAILASRLFRHKTRKQPFASLLLLILAAQAGLGAWLLYPASTP